MLKKAIQAEGIRNQSEYWDYIREGKVLGMINIKINMKFVFSYFNFSKRYLTV